MPAAKGTQIRRATKNISSPGEKNPGGLRSASPRAFCASLAGFYSAGGGEDRGVHVHAVGHPVEGHLQQGLLPGPAAPGQEAGHQGTGNLVIRNSASGNTTNYDIVANNKVGVIVVPPDSFAISGNTGGAGVGSTDPWANFSF